MIVENIKLENGTGLGLKFEMENAPLLVIKADKGFVMCGYLDMAAAEKLGDAAVRVSGVSSFDDVLNAEVAAATEAAKKLGVKEGMSGRQALELMF